MRLLIREQVDRQRKLVNIGLLASQVKDADFWVRDTATETGLWVRLVLAVAVALGGTTGHFNSVLLLSLLINLKVASPLGSRDLNVLRKTAWPFVWLRHTSLSTKARKNDSFAFHALYLALRHNKTPSLKIPPISVCPRCSRAKDAPGILRPSSTNTLCT